MYAHRLNQHTQLAVWYISEPEIFFLEKVKAAKHISHPHKRLQHLAGRYLLQHMVPDFPVSSIQPDVNNKPIVPGNPYHFSISHCDDFAAAIISSKDRVGIDIEAVEERVVKLRNKFLTLEEQLILQEKLAGMELARQLTLAWSAKEAMFKWLGETGVDFKKNLVLQDFSFNIIDGSIIANIVRTFIQPLHLNFRFMENTALTWTNTTYVNNRNFSR